MRKLDRFWDWFLPGLICLSPMGALAYYKTALEHEMPHFEPKRAGRRPLVSESHTRSAVIPLARL